jgi:probable F420-dependent oxidoreductase
MNNMRRIAFVPEKDRKLPIKINVTLPFDHVHLGKEFLEQGAIVAVAQATEKAGFYSGLVTDHPAPTGRWLDAGGHFAQDPFVILSLVSAVTTSLRLQTGILVLPYRNPFITARAVSTLDVFSGGRVSLGVGAGYLKGEYKALGVDFDSRNDLMDEYIKALKAAWTQDEFTFEGTGYQALGNRIHPRPVQQPHPPILIGGNSKRAIRRAAELGDAWNPFFTSGAVASTSRTVELTSEDQLAELIAYMHAHCDTIGRETSPEVVLGSFEHVTTGFNSQAMLDRAAGFAGMGVSAVAANFLANSRTEWCDIAQRFGEEVIARLP